MRPRNFDLCLCVVFIALGVGFFVLMTEVVESKPKVLSVGLAQGSLEKQQGDPSFANGPDKPAVSSKL